MFESEARRKISQDGGRAVSARNATTHGLFARDIVHPSLGEDPEGYRQLAEEFTAQLAPRNLLERHYVEKIAAASWRLRRLRRWQAQLFEDTTLTEDERLDRLDKVLRPETALPRTGGPGGPADRHSGQDAQQGRAAALQEPCAGSSLAGNDAN